MLTAALILGASGAGLAFLTGRRAEIRDAAREAQNPPEGKIVTVGGRAVHVVVTGKGPDLVLIHGAGGSTRDFTFDLAARLADRYRVFAVDRPGLGHSARIADDLAGAFAAAAESPAEQARHLAAAVRQLGGERPLVLGHSYGGAVAMAWALEQDAVGAIVVSGATMPWPGNIHWSYRVLGSRLGGAVLPHGIAAFIGRRYIERVLDNVFAPQAVPEGYLGRSGVVMATRSGTLRANARQVKTLRPHVAEMSARYPAVTIPVEILHGTADTSVYAEIHAVPLSRLLPNASLTLLDGVGHMLHHADPAAVVAAVDRAAARAGLRQVPATTRFAEK